ncbi:MAG TPA: PAS domain-containing sensor histidine kinase [Pyrinomonadaceae bacterium]|nr:PAS domain-containing sensor histidine kinase [Pyrinomonadaceae bacterium]
MDARRFRHLMDKVTNFAILFKNVDGIIEEWNVGAEHILGWRRDEALGKSVEMIYTPEDRVDRISEKEMAIAESTGVSEDERWHCKKDGSLFYASGLLHPIFEDGVLTGYVKIIRDLTERVSLEAALAESQNLTKTTMERSAEVDEAFKVLTVEADRRERDQILHTALVRRVMITQEDERKRISRDLHDHLGQKLTALRLRVELIKGEVADNQALHDQVAYLQQLAKDIDSEVDFLAWELRPAAIDELGLEIALNNFIQEWSRHFAIPAEFNMARNPDKRLAAPAEINLYRIAQEALNNIAKYADARKVHVTLADEDHSVTLIVEDDGVGFDLDEETNKEKGLGLAGMGERAAIMQGELKIETANGKGTKVYARIPAMYDDGAVSAN